MKNKDTIIHQPSLASLTLKARRMGIDTRKHLVIYMRADCPICRSEGFRSEARIQVNLEERWVIDLSPPLVQSLTNILKKVNK